MTEKKDRAVPPARLTITLPLEILIKVDLKREYSGLSRSAWVSKAVKEKIDSLELQASLTLEGLKKEIDEVKDMLKNSLLIKPAS